MFEATTCGKQAANRISITVNSVLREFDTNRSIADLLLDCGLTGKRIAVEKNGDIVPKSQHAATALVGGDRLEIVVAVGGG